MNVRACLPSILALAACGTGPEPFVPPAPPAVGFQLHLEPVVIQPGADVEFCSYFNLDSKSQLESEGKTFLLEELIANGVDLGQEEIAVGAIEVKGAPGLHHIQILSLGKDVEDVPDKHIFECAVDLFGGPLTGDVDPLFFTQRNELKVEYPAGVARILKRTADKDDPSRRRGAQLLYNFHYLNTTQAPITVDVYVNLHVVPRETIQHPVRSAWWNYIYFKATPGETSRIEGNGSFLLDVNLVGLTSHQHETGSLFTYSIGGEELYRNTFWAEPAYLRFEGTRPLAKGERIDFACEWQNKMVAPRYFGLQADDEMCTAVVEYYAKDEAEAEALFEMQRQEQMSGTRPRGPFSGEIITLERFVGMPDEVIEDLAAGPADPFAVLDMEIMCGIALNLKQMERQYGATESLESLQLLVNYLADPCRL